jgi:succinate dehydrogenase / fumarate reductase, cytochrome b subunit
MFSAEGYLMANKRPINLNLMSFKFPLTALVSIGHRISGVLMFLLIPVALYQLQLVLDDSVQGLGVLSHESFFLKFLVWVTLVATIYHVIAGIRHLVMDMGFGESFSTATKSAVVVFILLAITIVYVGVWVWM